MKPFESAARHLARRAMPATTATFRPLAALILAVAGLAFGAPPAHAQDEAAATDSVAAGGPAAADEADEAVGADNPWAPGRQWMSVRMGYAKSTEDSAGHGAGGYGLSYARMLSGLKLWKWTLFRNYSMGASVQHDVVGRFGPAAEIDVAAMLELTRHYTWSPTLHPYMGFGVGPVYRKTYRTGDDLRDASLGWLFMTGVNAAVSGRHLLGLDVRVSRLDGKNDPPNPVFGLGSVDSETSVQGVTTFKERPVSHWSIKANYSFTY